jgi:hypothetical protein
MRTNHRLGAAAAAVVNPWLAAAAAVATVAASVFLLHPPTTHAAQATGPVVSTAKTSTRANPRQLERPDALSVREGPKR